MAHHERNLTQDILKRRAKEGTYLKRLCKWMTQQGFGDITKRQSLLTFTNDEKFWKTLITKSSTM